MRSIQLSFLFLLIGGMLFSQEQHFEAKKGPITIVPIQHATFVLTWNNKVVYVDPTGGAEAFKNMPPPDLVLITDIHGDHFDPKTLNAVVRNTSTIVSPQAVADKLDLGSKKNLIVLKNFDTERYSDLIITALPMYNLPETQNAPHVRGRGNGYLVELGGKRVYISGDTEDIPEMRSLKKIDIAFVCMNLPYTMDVNQAAAAVLDFKPAVVIPYHYRGQDINKFKELVKALNNKIEVRLLEWYPKI